MSSDWRPMLPADLGSVERLGNSIHQDHPERPEIFAERLALCPEGCFVLGDMDGYVISHPWTLGSPPALDTLLGALPARADTWYIHDLALHERARGTGAAPLVVARLAALAAGRGFATLSLIAVGRSPNFWGRQGFVAAPLTAGKLDSYGSGAGYMVKRKEEASFSEEKEAKRLYP